MFVYTGKVRLLLSHTFIRMKKTHFYSKQIAFSDASVFDLMTLAYNLGIDDLKTACENHVTSSLSVNNACTFLTAVMDIQDKSLGECVFSAF